MPFLPVVIVSLLNNFAGSFTKPTWKYAQTLLIGTIICNGKRTVDLIPTISAAWYNKQDNATFSDVLIYVKKLILRENYINLSSENDDFVQISKQKLADLINIGLMNA